MDEIERSLVLPNGAKPMKDYARYYWRVENDRIAARFVVPLEPASGGCDVILPDDSTRPCTVNETVSATVAEMPAGERRWLEPAGEAPDIFDGGCSEVNILYDRRARRFLEVACNGEG
jgi:hypothetical protein